MLVVARAISVVANRGVVPTSSSAVARPGFASSHWPQCARRPRIIAVISGGVLLRPRSDHAGVIGRLVARVGPPIAFTQHSEPVRTSRSYNCLVRLRARVGCRNGRDQNVRRRRSPAVAGSTPPCGGRGFRRACRGSQVLEPLRPPRRTSRRRPVGPRLDGPTPPRHRRDGRALSDSIAITPGHR